MTCTEKTTHPPHAVNSTAGLTDLGDLIAHDTGNRYPYAGRRFVFSQPEGVHHIACADLLDRQRLDAVIDSFASTYPPETDRRALVSFWSLFYFSALMIDPIICWLELRRILPLAIDEIDLLIDNSTGLPSAFLLTNSGTVDPQATIHEAMSGVVRRHLEPLIAVMSKQAGLSKRLLWTNAAAYLTWMIDEIGHQGAETLKAEGMLLLEASSWPDGWKNPLHTMVRVDRTDSGDYIGHRRICCLRYAVPNVGGCGGSCPVAEGQIAARQG